MRILPFLFAALIAAQSNQPPPPAIIGRWDITIPQPNGGERGSWLEVRHSGVQTLIGQFVGTGGSARPISKVEFKDGEMRFVIPPQWERVDGDLVVTGKLSGDKLTGTMTLAGGRPQAWTAVRAPTLRRAAEPQWEAPAPIFNGRDLTGWHVIQGTNEWEAVDGVLRNRKSGGNIVTDVTFNDFKLHIEFRYPTDGNSGVYLRGRYEVQVADLPDAEPQIDGLGSIYGFLAPNAMVAKKAGEWQSFDVTLVGRLVTVALNGRTVITNQEIPGITGGALDSREGEPGPLFLQGDHGPIEYRNITLARAK